MFTNRVLVSTRLRLVVVVLVAAVGVIAAQEKSAPRSHFVLSSPDARLAAKVPDEYTANVFGCTGGNMSPALQWSGAPAGTKSFVVTVFDPDVPETGSGWWHWVVYDLPANVNNLPKGAGAEHSSVLPAGTQQGRTDLGNDAYHGPCPDQGQPPPSLQVHDLCVECGETGCAARSQRRDGDIYRKRKRAGQGGLRCTLRALR